MDKETNMYEDLKEKNLRPWKENSDNSPSFAPTKPE